MIAWSRVGLRGEVSEPTGLGFQLKEICVRWVAPSDS